LFHLSELFPALLLESNFTDRREIMKHLDRRRAEGFGALADRYERTRPSYPAELIAWLSRDGPGTAVDVGCGTGRVALLLATAGWNVVGIEPDKRMAAIARSHGIQVIVSTFEQWKPPRNDFDLVAAGTSWHWVDPAIGYDKAASVLRSNGRLAIFRNSYQYDAGITAIIELNLRRHTPHLLSDCVPLGTAGPNYFDSHRKDIEHRRDLFTDLEHRAFRHERVVTVQDWIEELTTHSPIMLLDATVADHLLADLASQVTSEAGNNVHIVHETHCLLAKRR
jgi:SAM-dependent methyltransferase